MSGAGYAAEPFDPVAQPLGIGPDHALAGERLGSGGSTLYRPWFNDLGHWGDLLAHPIAADGSVTLEPSWSAAVRLGARDPATRRILTRRDDTGAAVPLSDIDALSAAQRSLLGGQDMVDYLRGDDTAGGGGFRPRYARLGPIVRSSPRHVVHDPADPGANRVYVGANDGMLHAFDAASGEEAFAYLPGALLAPMVERADRDAAPQATAGVDGHLTVADVRFADGSARKVLVGGLGAGGQGWFALDISDTDVATDAALARKLLWEIDDGSPGMAALGHSYGRPLVVRLDGDTAAGRWAVILANGYMNTRADGHAGAGTASLLVVDLETGALLRELDTHAGTATSPNGLSSPAAVDLDGDGTVERVYAGDLDGALWAFDLDGAVPSAWNVAFDGLPLFLARDAAGATRAITAPPRVVRRRDGDLLVMVGTGRLLDEADLELGGTDAVYGSRDRLDGQRPAAEALLVQSVTEGAFGTRRVRTLGAKASGGTAVDGWRLDLPAGERVLVPMRLRNGNLLFSSWRPAPTADDAHGGGVWTTELRYENGGAPRAVVYDMNGDGMRSSLDNVDGNADGDRVDPEDRVAGLYRGEGLIVSSPRLAILGADTGVFYVNQIRPSPPLPHAYSDAGVLGGHFDVDTASYIAEPDNGSTDSHVHEYDEKHDVLGVDYFAFLDDGLHEITEDVPDPAQRFKLLVVNADLSPGGRFSINRPYDAEDPSSYAPVTFYDDIALDALPVHSLGGVSGTTRLESLSMSFDAFAIADRGLFPTQTGCVRKNTPGSGGEWRNGSLTTWAVAVDASGADDFELSRAADGSGRITGITRGLLWESTLFWHWDGPCAHEYAGLDAEIEVDGRLTTVWDHYSARSLDEHTADGGGTLPPIVSTDFTDVERAVPDSDSPPAALWVPGRTSWTELLR